MSAYDVRNLTEGDRRHREEFVRFVLEEAEAWHREHLGHLYSEWARFNATYFAGSLVPPYILLTATSHPRAAGDCGPHSSFGGKLQIRIRETLVNGKHKIVRAGDEFAEGRRRIVEDVLLHEAIHQWQMETLGHADDGYRGHGPTFRDKCNEIGAALGLLPVRMAKKRGADRDLPSCAQWPHNVRPLDYYLGAFVSTSGDADTGDDEGDEAEKPDVPEVLLVPAEPHALAAALVRLLAVEDLAIVRDALLATMPRDLALLVKEAA